MSKAKILVTGGAGYIGSHVVKALKQVQKPVLTIDNLSTGYQQAVTFGKFIKMDLGEEQKLESIFKENEIESVFHFAGSIIVPESVERPMKYYQNNTSNSQNLIKLCLEHNVKNFIFSSTAAVYGNVKEGVCHEDTPTSPLNPYAWSKLMTEQMLSDAQKSKPDFNYVALRYFNVCGADPEGEIGQAFPGATHLIKVNVEAAQGKRDKTYIYGTDYPTKDGTGVRDYIHVKDLASAHIEAFKFLEKEKRSETFNCGYGQGHSVKEVIDAVKRVTKVDYPVIEEKRRAGDGAKIVADNKKILSQTEWKIEHNNLDQIILDAFKWEGSERLKSWTSR